MFGSPMESGEYQPKGEGPDQRGDKIIESVTEEQAKFLFWQEGVTFLRAEAWRSVVATNITM